MKFNLYEYRKITIGLLVLVCGSVPLCELYAESVFLMDGMTVDELDLESEAKRDLSVHNPTGEETRRRMQLYNLEAPSIRNQPLKRQNQFEQNTQQRALEHIQMAEKYIEKQEWDHARYQIEKALELVPDSLLVLRRAAAVSAIARQYQMAADYFEQCLALNPDDVPYRVGYAGALIRLQRYDEAEEQLKQALEQQPEYLAGRFHRAALDVMAHNFEALEGNWDNLGYYEIGQVAGWLYADQDELKEMLSESGFIFLCDSLLGLGTYSHLQDITTGLNEADRAMEIRNWARAAKALEGISDAGLKSFYPGMRLAQCYSLMEDYDAAVKEMDRLRRLYPGEVAVWYNSGYVLMLAGRYKEAESVFRKAYDLDSSYRDTRFAIACSLAAQDRMDDAWVILEELAEEHPENMRGWIEGDADYLMAIRADERFQALVNTVSQRLRRK
jgi:tetratricopeptide (TPR) repeat protein